MNQGTRHHFALKSLVEQLLPMVIKAKTEHKTEVMTTPCIIPYGMLELREQPQKMGCEGDKNSNTDTEGLINTRRQIREFK